MPPGEWTPLAVGFWRDPKVIGSSADCKLLVLASFCFAQGSLTDGFVPANALNVIAADAGVKQPKRAAAEAVRRGLWATVDGGWCIPSWADWNKDAGTVREERRQKQQAGAHGNHLRWHARRGLKVEGCQWCYPQTPDRSSDRTSESQNHRTSDRTTDRTQESPPTPTPTTDTDQWLAHDLATRTAIAPDADDEPPVPASDPRAQAHLAAAAASLARARRNAKPDPPDTDDDLPALTPEDLAP